jgi:hypothetical protein
MGRSMAHTPYFILPHSPGEREPNFSDEPDSLFQSGGARRAIFK